MKDNNILSAQASRSVITLSMKRKTAVRGEFWPQHLQWLKQAVCCTWSYSCCVVQEFEIKGRESKHTEKPSPLHLLYLLSHLIERREGWNVGPPVWQVIAANLSPNCSLPASYLPPLSFLSLSFSLACLVQCLKGATTLPAYYFSETLSPADTFKPFKYVSACL